MNLVCVVHVCIKCVCVCVHLCESIREIFVVVYCKVCWSKLWFADFVELYYRLLSSFLSVLLTNIISVCSYEDDPNGIFESNEDSLLNELHLATTGSSATGMQHKYNAYIL